jgi:uncharacterized repeat protein (TIGR01451 family)
MTFRGLRKQAVPVVLLVLLGTVSVFGQENAKSDGVQVGLNVFRVGVNAEGKEVLEPGDKVKPGEILEYQTVYTNTGKEAVSGLQAHLPIPKEMIYAAGTADPVSVQASLDGTKYENVPLMREVKLRDGKTEMREVPYEEYRFLRWGLGKLEPKQSVTTRARVRLGHEVAVHPTESTVKSGGASPKSEAAP